MSDSLAAAFTISTSLLRSGYSEGWVIILRVQCDGLSTALFREVCPDVRIRDAITVRLTIISTRASAREPRARTTLSIDVDRRLIGACVGRGIHDPHDLGT